MNRSQQGTLLLRRMAGPLWQRRGQERELEAIRAALLRERMAGWQRAQARRMARSETAPAAERRMRRDVAAMSVVELHRIAAGWQRQEAERRQQKREMAARPPRARGPSLGI